MFSHDCLSTFSILQMKSRKVERLGWRPLSPRPYRSSTFEFISLTRKVQAFSNHTIPYLEVFPLFHQFQTQGPYFGARHRGILQYQHVSVFEWFTSFSGETGNRPYRWEWMGKKVAQRRCFLFSELIQSH